MSDLESGTFVALVPSAAGGGSRCSAQQCRARTAPRPAIEGGPGPAGPLPGQPGSPQGPLPPGATRGS